MEFDLRLMSVAHWLEKHPVLSECVTYKIKYLNFLEYFIGKYSKKDVFSNASLKVYKEKFLGNDLDKYFYDVHEFDEVTGLQLEGIKLQIHRYSFVCDCLYMNAMFDLSNAKKIVNEIKKIYRNRYRKRLELLLSILYFENNNIKEFEKIHYQIQCWRKNRNYLKQKKLTVLTTANMSAGKSTLINAIVGKNVNRTMNGACTSKIHYIYDKAFEDDLIYELDGNLNLNADETVLFYDDMNNMDDNIYVSTHFQLLSRKQSKLCIIDTPGVNSSLNYDHTHITMNAILNGDYDKLLYLVNAENAGTEDDLKYLQFICENVDEHKIIFVLNKLDRFRIPEDSIEDSINHLKNDLVKLGLTNPIVCPISAYTARLAKKILSGCELNEDENDDFMFLQRKFKKEEYNLSKFYPESLLNKLDEIYCENDKSPFIELLINCGELCLEYIITEGANNYERDIN